MKEVFEGNGKGEMRIRLETEEEGDREIRLDIMEYSSKMKEKKLTGFRERLAF